MDEQELQNDVLENNNDDSVVTQQDTNEELISAQQDTYEEPVLTQPEEPRAHQVPNDSPYSPLYNPYANKEKKGNTLTIILIVLLGVFLVTALIFAVSKVVESAMSEVSRSSKTNNFQSKVEEFFEGENEKPKDNSDEKHNTESDEKTNEFDDLPDEETFDFNGAYVPKATDEYYVEFADAIVEDLNYSIEKKEYSYFDDDKNVDINITYPQITGDNVRNIENINEEIESAALFYQKNFASHPEKGKVSDCSIEILGYVTYMDEEVCSIVLQEECYLPDIVNYLDLYAININMVTGQIMDNTTMLDYSEQLGKEFRKKSEYQNGTNEGVDMLSDEEIADYLKDAETGVIFYTPVGLELGFNYYYDVYPGWVTATFKEYSDYIKKI